MKRMIIVILALSALLIGFTAPVMADGFYVSTDRTSYTGTLTKYNTLADAQAQQNSVGGPYTIPDRVTDAPYNNSNRDLTLFIVNNAPSYYSNYNQIMTSWYYTTNQTTAPYSGSGNPNNTNTGFLQIADAGSTTVTSSSGAFGNFNGTNYTTFHLQVSGENATYDNSYARLWPAPLVGGAGSLSVGTFISYSLDATFGGLVGTVQNGMITSSNHPTSVDGTFNAIFQNLDPIYQGFYDVNFTLGMDNWAYGQGNNLNGAFATSEFGQVPLPGTLLLLGSGLVGLGFYRRRKASLK